MSRGNKKPKDKNAPRKNQSSYFIFSNERRPILSAGDSNLSVTEISKKISAEWKIMDESRKKHYEERAAEEKTKYLSKLAEYQKTDDFQIYQKKLAEWKENKAAIDAAKKGKRGKPPKKPKQPESMPKRPQSSYFVFSNERRSQMRDEYPNKKLTELSKLIAEEWKKKTETEKKEYEDRAAILKEKYTVKIEEYKKTSEYSEYQDRLSEWKQEKKRWENDDFSDSDDNKPKISLPRKPKDDKCPKRPLTSYFLYAKEVREATKQEHPNLPITDIAKEISKKWKILSEDEKKPYNEEAARRKEQYKKDLEEYQGSDSQIAFKKKLEEWKIECDRRRQAAKAKAAKMKLNQKKKSPKKSPKKKGRPRKTRMEVESDSDSDSSSSSDSDSDSDSSSGSSSSSGSDSDSDSSSSE